MNPLEMNLRGLAIGPYRYYECIDSTNDEAARWANQGATDLTLVIANQQTAGRGRLQRKWHTSPNAALAFSLVLRSNAQDISNQTLTALGALAVCEALQELFTLPAEIKWPNDVLVHGKKLAGILVEAYWEESKLDYAILGIGINIASPSVPAPEELIFPATCIEACLSQTLKVDRWALLRAVLNHLLVWRPRLAEKSFIEAWDQRLAWHGEWVQIYPAYEPIGNAANRPIREGKLIGLAPGGDLMLIDRDGNQFDVQMGEIHLRPSMQ